MNRDVLELILSVRGPSVRGPSLSVDEYESHGTSGAAISPPQSVLLSYE